jgi:hypothetical protein
MQVLMWRQHTAILTIFAFLITGFVVGEHPAL